MQMTENTIERKLEAIKLRLASSPFVAPHGHSKPGISKFDVCINIWGKPYQTAVAVNSLLSSSSDIIGNIFLVIEKVQPASFDLSLLLDNIDSRDLVITYTPKYYLAPNELADLELFKNDQDYRHSIRYQYAIDSSRRKWLLLLHNDILITSSLRPILDQLLDNNERYFAAGDIGQCWNCPLPPACDGGRLLANIRGNDLSPEFIANLVNEKPQLRTYQRKGAIDFSSPFPMPECRVNEWFAFLNLDAIRHASSQIYIPPFGAYTWSRAGSYTNDIGEDWFRAMLATGKEFYNIDHSSYMIHGPFRGNSHIPAGHSSYLSANIYDQEEAAALDYLLSNNESQGHGS
jgi:hypothetical protein